MRSSIQRALVAAVVSAASVLGAGSAAEAAWVTSLPELELASVESTTTAEQASDSGPAGTTVAFHFDEVISASNPDPAKFLLYDVQGARSVASAVRVDDDTVTALFPTVDSQEESDNQSAAVTLAGAVQGGAGDANPTESLGLTRWTFTEVTGPQGCVLFTGGTNLRHVRNITRLDFGFSSCGYGYNFVDPEGLRLQLVDGRSIRGTQVRYHSKNPERGTVTFPGRIARREIGRVTLAEASVEHWFDDEIHSEEYNEVQALAMSHRGNTVRPDLVRVKLLGNQDPHRPDHAMFVFDQPVNAPVASRFALGSSHRGTRAVVRGDDRRRVLVAFSPEATDRSTSGSVRPGAVRNGRSDAVSISQILRYGKTSSGETARPDLGSVYPIENEEGTSTLTILFEFDAELAGAPEARAFHLYGQDGTRYDTQDCALSPSPHRQWDPSFVVCTFPTAPTGPRILYLATADASAVHNVRGAGNREGSEYT